MEKYFLILCQMYDIEGRFCGSVDSGVKSLVFPNLIDVRNGIMKDVPNVRNVAISQVLELSKEQFEVNFKDKEILEIL